VAKNKNKQTNKKKQQRSFNQPDFQEIIDNYITPLQNRDNGTSFLDNSCKSSLNIWLSVSLVFANLIKFV